MKTLNLSALVLVALLFILIPAGAQAYFTTGQTASQLTSTTALYTIEYAFGLTDHDIYMPILAARNLPWKSEEHKAGYSINAEEAGTKMQGTSAGIVVANLPVVNGMYKIAKGAAQKMTLLVLYTAPKGSAKDAYSLQVGQLPYYVDRKGTGKDLETLQLNPTELQYYVTEKIELTGASESK